MEKKQIIVKFTKTVDRCLWSEISRWIYLSKGIVYFDLLKYITIVQCAKKKFRMPIKHMFHAGFCHKVHSM